MATDKFSDLKELTVKAPNKGIISFTSSGAIPMWSPVKLTGGGTGILPTVAETTIVNDPQVIGIAVGGSGTPVNTDGTTGNAADGAGDIVDVAVLNSGVITKVKVDGTTIILGSVLNTSATDGTAGLFAAAGAGIAHILGKALQTSSTASDVILIFMGGSI